MAAYAYKAAARQAFETIVLVGPSHFAAFDGVALYGEGAFETPLGVAIIDAELAGDLSRAAVIEERRSPHVREHSLEMQLPFVKRLMPEARIVPLLMGFQTRETIAGSTAPVIMVGTGSSARRPQNPPCSGLTRASTSLSGPISPLWRRSSCESKPR